MIGATIGHYQILEKLGEGGMGEVYKARDVLLNRTAALKLLPADSAATQGKRHRFVQEAQSASALNHPNIVTIYEVATDADRDFIAMELVHGQTLDQIIGNKPMALERVLACGIQIADALAAAHAAGIVHRDLKPGNVMVSDAGLVKVLDFGLAKLMPGPAGPSGASETVLAGGPRTLEGTILGTVAYMSPEQAEGKPVDQRSDIFSFGAVLLEMLTGRRAFQGESTASTLAAILTADPPELTQELPGVPVEIRRIVGRCLRKAPSKRWQSIADVGIALEEIKQDFESGRLHQVSVIVPSRRRWVPVAAVGVLAAALGALAVWGLRPAPAPPDQWRITRLTADSGASLFPAISPDGRLVSYVSDRGPTRGLDLWLQQIEGGDPMQVTRDLGPCLQSDFSPDGTRIAVRCGAEPGSIYVIPTLGGLPQKISDGGWPRFSPDGSTLSYVEFPSNSTGAPSIWIASVNGGSAPTELKPGKGFSTPPLWRPDGKGLFIVGFGDSQGTPNEFDWYFVPVNGSPVVPLGANARLKAAGFGSGRYLTATRDGVLFSQGTTESSNIYLMPFDSTFQRITGEPVPVIVGAGYNYSPSASKDGSRIAFAVGNNLSNNIWRAPLDAATGVASPTAVQVTNSVSPSLMPSPSRDGTRLAYLGGPRNAPEIRLRDLASGTDQRLAQAKEWTFLALSADGSMVAFNSDQREQSAVYSVPTSGGVPKRLCTNCGRPVEWTNDRTNLLIDNAGSSHREIHILDVATGQTKPLLQHSEFALTMPRLSPDGRAITFTQIRPGRARRIYLAAFTGNLVPEQEWSVVIDGSNLDRQPFWSAAGNALYFISDRDGSRCVWGQRVDVSTRRPIGEPFAAHHVHQFRYNLMDLDPASIGLSLAGGQMFYAASDLQSNIWLAEKQRNAAR